MGPGREPITVRECVVQSVFLVLVVTILLPGVVLRQEVALPGNLLFDWAPWSHHAPADFKPVTNETTFEVLGQFALWFSLTKQALAQGQWPLWNPYEMTGVPLMANGQSAAFYPLYALHALIDVPVAMTIYIFVKTWLCGLTAYLCARVFDVRKAASRIVSVAWMLCGYHAVWLYWEEPNVNCWLPVVLIGAEWLLMGLNRRGFFMLTLGATLLLLAGHQETAFVNGLGVGVYFVMRMALERRSPNRMWRPAALALAAWVVALLASAVQLVPLAEYIAHSWTEAFRAVDEKEKFYVGFGGVVAMWVPRFFGSNCDNNFWGTVCGDLNSVYHNITYTGVPVLVCAALTLATGKRPRLSRHRTIAMAVAGAFIFMLACNLSIVAPFNRLPVIRALRGIYYVSFVTFSLAMLAGLGLTHWWSRMRTVRALMLPAAVVLAPTLGVIALYHAYGDTIAHEGMNTYVAIQIAVACAIGTGTLACLVPAVRGGNPRIWTLLIVAVLTFDVLYAARGMHTTCRRSDLFVDTDLTRALQQEEGPIRVVGASGGVPAGMLPMYGLDAQWGYDGICPARVMEFYRLGDSGNWPNVGRLASLTHYVFRKGTGPEPDERWHFLQTVDGLDLYRDTGAFPRTFLVPAVRQLPSHEAVLKALASPSLDPAAEALTDWPGIVVPRATKSLDVLAETRLESRNFGRASVSVSTPEPAVLVMTEAWFPGWKAEVNGEPTVLFPVYGAFRGVVVPEGVHEVRFSYEPASFRLGMTISVMTLLATGALSVVLLARGRAGVVQS